MSTCTLFRCVLSLLVLGALSTCLCGPCACIAAREALVVKASPDGGVLSGVTAVLMGSSATDGVGDCSADSAIETTCSMPLAAAGNYSVQVSAPGFQTANLPVTLSETPPVAGAGCSCPGAALSPNVVVLTPVMAMPYACFDTISPDGRMFDAGPGPYDMCDLNTQYCLVQWSADPSWPPHPQCPPLPSECSATPTCACICQHDTSGLYCGTTCLCDDDGGYPHVSCRQV